MLEHVRTWSHVFKLDPDKEISDGDLERICESGTDAIIVGGSSGVTLDNTFSLLRRLQRYALPCALEVSDTEAVVAGFDYYFIPVVLNAGHTDWLVGRLHEAICRYGSALPWDRILTEGYVILNPDCTAARVTGANASLRTNDVVSYATMVEHMFRFPIIYLEYSGSFGDMDLLQAVSEEIGQARLFYGGGIDNADKAAQAAKYAHTVVVGNVIYDNMTQALATVRGVRQVRCE